jgi:hypothetical protein
MNARTLTVEEVLNDSGTSFWLKSALQTSLERDPVDALNDTLVLAAILDIHLRVVLGLPEAE